ncbi:sugar kinase, partial [Clostridioides difficile]|nr:sugar kinase [Clostridioides difficile]
MNILAFGEIMMRLSVPDYKFLTQTNELNYVITGTGLNILSGLKNFGYNTYMLTKLPNNNVGKASSANIRKLGVKDDFITYGGNHIGVYFLESGYGERPSEVTYLNRLNSSFCESKLQDYDINKCLEGMDVVHICGIAMQLTDSVKEIALELARKSYEKGIKVFFDFNFRQSLNPEKTYDDLVNDYKKMLPYC